MIKKIFASFVALLMAFQFTSCDTLQQVAGEVLSEVASAELTPAQIGNGLKEALELGIGKGADKLSMTDGYLKNAAYKILLPEEVRKVTDKLQNIPGFNQIEGEMLKLLNRGAEDAAKSAKPIFVEAIKQMTFQDATSILMGNKDAATTYLNKATYDKLARAFKPKITASLDKVNATQTWNKAFTAYNKIPFIGEKVDTNLDDYVTRQALKGLFGMVEKEELNIRNNVAARTTDLLKRVFAKQD